jgi:hypothetical protein
MGNYIEREHLEDRLSADVVRRIYDDNNDGTPDAGPLIQVIADAERRFESAMIGIYPSLTELRATAPTTSSIVLDLAEALAAKRFPRCVNREWQPLLEDANKQMKEYRTGVAKLPVVGAPNPPANVGGDMFIESVGLSGEQRATFTRNGFGDY